MQSLYDMLNINGLADTLKYWHGKQNIERMEKELAGETMRASVGRPRTRGFSSQTAFVATLVKLRTGLGTKVISTCK